MAVSKLTLSIEPDIIENAKAYAKRKHTSISKLVQEYLSEIAVDENKDQDDIEISDWVKQLVVVNKPTPDFDHKADYRDHINKKYSS